MHSARYAFVAEVEHSEGTFVMTSSRIDQWTFAKSGGSPRRRGRIGLPVERGPALRCPSRRLRAIPKDNLLGQIDEGAQARGHVAASWIIEAISGIRGRPLA